MPLHTPETGRTGVMRACMVQAETRFWQKVKKDGPITNDARGPCWEWTGAKWRGYGSFFLVKEHGRSRTISAHKFSYQLTHGPVPPGTELDHLCRNRCCVNPRHLEPVSHKENVLRGDLRRVQGAKTHCAQGHPYNEENTYRWRGRRVCKACNRVSARTYARQKRQGASNARS